MDDPDRNISVQVSQPNQPLESIISVKKVSRVYRIGTNEVHALHDLSMDMPAGIMGALKGRSGSGKTTLLNLVGGLDRPTAGEVFLFGESLENLSAEQLTELRRKRLGFVFQSFAIMPTFSALENVELIMRIAGITENRRERAIRCLEIVGLGHWASHRPWELSGGQQQRVAIARAIATHPDLILADEPTGELDSATGRQILTLFRYIVEKEGITVLVATHDPVVEDYAHVIYELADGQVKNVRSTVGR
jgi:ABC-type lipoprotein export system ATPase subunit